GHVEDRPISVGPEAELEDRVDRDAAGLRPAVALEKRPGDLPDEVGGEPLVAGRDRGVDREDAVAADLLPGRVEFVARGDVLAGALCQQERRVSLVQVPHGRLDAERTQGTDAPRAENELL